VKAKQRRGSKSFYVDKTVGVEVEIDEDDLADAGYHHGDDCPAARRDPLPGEPDVRVALASLHRQAHPGARPDIFLCPEEPCRSLGLDLVGPVR
jgi:hypothetical protein